MSTFKYYDFSAVKSSTILKYIEEMNFVQNFYDVITEKFAKIMTTN